MTQNTKCMAPTNILAVELKDWVPESVPSPAQLNVDNFASKCKIGSKSNQDQNNLENPCAVRLFLVISTMIQGVINRLLSSSY